MTLYLTKASTVMAEIIMQFCHSDGCNSVHELPWILTIEHNIYVEIFENVLSTMCSEIKFSSLAQQRDDIKSTA